MTRHHRSFKALLRILLFLCFCWVLGPHTPVSPAQATANPYTLFFPIINQNLSPFRWVTPIWAHAAPPSGHEVVLFRATFPRPGQVENVRLSIFADTRYEVWMDGEWLGRGPARFSTTYHEYDMYALDHLSPGTHQIAVLVQWAPNLRRAESTTPYLQAMITAENDPGPQILLETGPAWKALVSPAWQTEPEPVHPWQLIGPTELMDFRKYPGSWRQPGFNDQAWPNAVIKDPQQIEPFLLPEALPLPFGENEYYFASPDPGGVLALSQRNVEYQPRSIPLLANQPIPYTLLEAGRLSPGAVLAEFAASLPDPHTLNFTALAATSLTLERLFATSLPSPVILLDGAPFTWAPAANRPFVQTTSANIAAGAHQIRFEQLPSVGFPLALSTPDLNWGTDLFQQGLHAGRRLLLANFVPTPGVITQANNLLTVNQTPAYFVLELPRTVHGRLVTNITGPTGTVVDIGWSEHLLENTLRPLPFPGDLFPDWNQTDSWILDGNPRRLTTLDTRTGRYLLIAIWGNGPVSFQDLQILEESYPVTQLGQFNSPDPRLNQIWQLGVDSAIVNMLDAYADPWRERGQWWGDAYIVDHINQIAFGDQTLVKRGLRLMAGAFTQGRPVAMAPNGNTIGVHMLDYGMLWAHSLQEYLLRTDDRAFAYSMYPTMLQFLEYLTTQTNPQTGLLDLPRDHWSKTAYIDTYGFHDRYGQSTALNSLYYATLHRAAWIADYLNQHREADIWTLRAAQVRQQINAVLYNPLTHQYAANLSAGQLRTATYQAQAWALAYDIVPSEDVPYVAESLLTLLPDDPSTAPVSIYGMYWVLEALAKAGRMQDALALIHRYYGYLLDNGATTLWERFDANKDYQASLSHGWGAAPTWFLTTHLAGLQPTGPATWQAQPNFALESLTATLPLPYGPLVLTWHTENCQTTLTLQAPAQTEGTLILPNETRPIPAGVTTLSLPNTCPNGP